MFQRCVSRWDDCSGHYFSYILLCHIVKNENSFSDDSYRLVVYTTSTTYLEIDSKKNKLRLFAYK